MTEQQPGGEPENFDAFSRPANPGDTWVANPAYYAPLDPYGVDDAEGQPPVPPPAGFKARLAGMGKGKLIGGAVVVALVLGGAAWGTSAALASSGSSSPAASAAGAPADTPTAVTGKGARKGGNGMRAVRLKITSVSMDSFVGTDAKGQSITVAFGDSTHFGTKGRPLSPDQLAVGMVVTVAGDRSGGSVDATAIVPAKAGAGASGGVNGGVTNGADGGAAGAPSDPATTDGNA